MKKTQAQTLRDLDAIAVNRCLDKQNFNPTDWMTAQEARAWKRLVKLNEQGKIKDRPQIICVVSDGLLREVWATDHATEVTSLNFEEDRQAENKKNNKIMDKMCNQRDYKEVY